MGDFYIWRNDEHTDWIYFVKKEIYVIGYNSEDGWMFTHYTEKEAKHDNVSKESWILGPDYPLVKVDFSKYSKLFIEMLFEKKYEE